MITTFASLKKIVRIYIESATLPSGKAFPHAGSFGPNKEWKVGGATMGAAPDGRQLPEWVEFEWSEQIYGQKYSLEEMRALPRHKQRVMIRDRISLDAVREVLQSKRDTPRGKLPEKVLWVYFVWTADGVKFRWHVERTQPARGEPRVLREGGDKLP